MDFRHIKKLAAVSAVALSFAFGAQDANAQTTAQIGATLTTAAGLSSAAGNNLDFGTWVINRQSGETITLPLLSLPTGAAPAVPIPGGVTNSVVVNTVAPAASGTVTVTSPIATDLEIQGVISTNFAEATLTLGTLTYSDFDTANGALPAAYDGTVVTAQTGGAAETIGIGGTITIAGGNPPEATTFNDAVIDVSFRY